MPLSAITHRDARIIVLGRPGSGKGTQSARLARQLGVPHVSTGDLLRAAAARETSTGRTVRALMGAGDLVPDDLVLELVDATLTEQRAAGFVLDGFPRTVTQAERLLELDPRGVDVALDLVVSPAVARTRLLERRVCGRCGSGADATSGVRPGHCDRCGGALTVRADDRASTVSRRLADYDAQAAPLLAWLTTCGLLVAVDGHGTPDAVAALVDAACTSPRTGDLVS